MHNSNSHLNYSTKHDISSTNSIEMSNLHTQPISLVSKIGPVLRSISASSSASLTSVAANHTNSPSPSSTLLVVNKTNDEQNINETYRNKDTRKSSIVFDKAVTKRRLSQVKVEINASTTATQESGENDC